MAMATRLPSEMAKGNGKRRWQRFRQRQKFLCTDSEIRGLATGGVLITKMRTISPLEKLWKSAFQRHRNHLNRSCSEEVMDETVDRAQNLRFSGKQIVFPGLSRRLF